MNSKFLYAATLAVSLLSTLAMADEAPVSRAQVTADLQKAIANGTLQRSDHDAPQPMSSTRSNTPRTQVVREFAQDRSERQVLVGPDANRDYNPVGTRVLGTSTLARSAVRNEVLQAAADGTLQRSDYEDAASMALKARAHTASATFAQRVKAKFRRDAS